MKTKLIILLILTTMIKVNDFWEPLSDGMATGSTKESLP